MAVKIGGQTVNVSGGGGKVMSPAMYPARLVQAIYLGTQENQDYNTKEMVDEDTFLFTFEFPTELVEYNGEEKPRWLSRSVKISDFEKSNFYKICNALKPGYSPEKDDPFEMVNSPCMVTTGLTKTGKARIMDVNPAVAGFPIPDLVSDPVVFNVKAPDMAAFMKLPEWLQNICVKNKDFEGSDLQLLLDEENNS